MFCFFFVFFVFSLIIITYCTKNGKNGAVSLIARPGNISANSIAPVDIVLQSLLVVTDVELSEFSFFEDCKMEKKKEIEKFQSF